MFQGTGQTKMFLLAGPRDLAVGRIALRDAALLRVRGRRAILQVIRPRVRKGESLFKIIIIKVFRGI